MGVIHTHTHTHTHTHSQSWLVTCPYVIGTRPATELTAGQFHVTVSYLYSLPSLPLCERACFARRARKGSLGRARKRGGAANYVALALKPKYVITEDGNTRIDQHLIDAIMIPFIFFDGDARKLSIRFALTATCISRWLLAIGEADVVL